MAQLNSIARALIRMAFGTALSPGSHNEALTSYLRAAELNPHRLIHRRVHSDGPHRPLQCSHISLAVLCGVA